MKNLFKTKYTVCVETRKEAEFVSSVLNRIDRKVDYTIEDGKYGVFVNFACYPWVAKKLVKTFDYTGGNVWDLT